MYATTAAILFVGVHVVIMVHLVSNGGRSRPSALDVVVGGGCWSTCRMKLTIVVHSRGGISRTLRARRLRTPRVINLSYCWRDGLDSHRLKDDLPQRDSQHHATLFGPRPSHPVQPV